MGNRMNSDNNGNGSRFPDIVLDTTLADLLADEPGYKAGEALCNIKPCADPQHHTLPLNKKYLITSTKTSDEDDLAHLLLENVSYLLSFWAGHMEVALMACQGSSDDETLTREIIDRNSHQAFSVLTEKQRPIPRTFSNKDHFVQYHGSRKTRIRWGFAVDFAERMPCFLHPELQYQLNSKRWLAECSLRSANDRILDPKCTCSTHSTDGGLWYHGGDCQNCKGEVEQELKNLVSKLQDTRPPFVLKLAQCLGSVGTMLVRNEADREKTIKHITQVQKDQLPCVTAENAHIYPASLVLSDFLPGDTHALNFFVRRDGSVKFLGSCQQLSTRVTEGGKQHTALTWTDQERLEKRFTETLHDIGKVLHDKGYFGPCGADIMETDDATQYVIDLNVRTTTSMVLGCLHTHCKERGFDACAVYECLLLQVSREQLGREFEKEFQEGRIILLGNTRLGKKKRWAYPVVLAGEDQDAIKALGTRILRHEAGVDSNAQDAGGA